MNLGSSGFMKVDSLQWHLALARLGRRVWVWEGSNKAALRLLGGVGGCNWWSGRPWMIGGKERLAA